MAENLSLEMDMTPWLQQLTAELDAAVADLAHTMQAVESGTYAENISGQRFGLARLNFPDGAQLALAATERAAETCFRSVMARLISFLDRLIASEQVRREGIAIERDLSSEQEITDYLNGYMTQQITRVASDRKFTNPKKLDLFPALSDFSKRAALGYFALRRSLEHHQGIATEDIEIPFLRLTLLADDAEITALPWTLKQGRACA